ncbi:hypothetical protein ACI3L3_11760 [Desulfobaculum sp. SPO524]|uniref:hypothetical protein n=1 Tax=Desulfobaculum sp. SPO524 TaxID=3378071 RepID=UPI003852EFB8
MLFSELRDIVDVLEHVGEKVDGAESVALNYLAEKLHALSKAMHPAAPSVISNAEGDASWLN